jgi:hypothetical protein
MLTVHSVLDPSQKTKHIRKYWGEAMLKEALALAEEKVYLYSHVTQN